MKKIMGLLMVGLFSASAYAGVCEIYTERTACPGKETESYVKCGGKQSCSSKKSAKTAEECTKLAEAECSNSRLDITKSKVIKAKFDGKETANLCAADRADFNKCSK